MRPLNNWMFSAVRTLAVVTLVVSFAWTAIGGLVIAQVPVSGILWTSGITWTDGITWSD